MAIPLVTDVLAGTAALLGDTAQEQFTSGVLLQPYSMAFREAYDLFQRWHLQVANRDGYMYVPANTTVVVPSAAGITDMGEPSELWERPSVSTLTITGVTNATPMVVTTSTAHGLADGSPVEIYGVVGPVGINQQWRITSTGSTTFSLNGSIAGGAYSSGGTVIFGGEQSSNRFIKMNPVTENLPQIPPSDRLVYWKWEGDWLEFIGATNPVELKIEYSSSGAAPQSGSVGIDNSYNFLVYRTASIIGPAYDQAQSAANWKMEALGPSGQADGTGGALRAFAYPMLVEQQKRPARPLTFRPRRRGLNRFF